MESHRQCATAVYREDILGMEKNMLAALEYDLTVPTGYLFVARFRKAASVQDDIKVRNRLLHGTMLRTQRKG